jgi:cold shock CspA family protein
MDDSLTGAIDKWRDKQEDDPSRPEAIRRLVEIGLKKAK